MKNLKNILGYIGLILLMYSCTDEINYDEFSTVPLIKNVEIEVETDPSDFRIVNLKTTAEGNDFFDINWGDGPAFDRTETGEISHSYSSKGDFVITVTARKFGLENVKKTLSVAVGIISNLNISQTFVEGENDRVSLDLSATNATNYDIDWGDGTTIENFSKDEIPEHKYGSKGEYEITVTAKAEGFESEVKKIEVEILDASIDIIVLYESDFSDETAFNKWNKNGNDAALSIADDPIIDGNKVYKSDGAKDTNGGPNGFTGSGVKFDNPTPKNAIITIEFDYLTTATDNLASDFFRFSKTPAIGTAPSDSPLVKDSRIIFQYSRLESLRIFTQETSSMFREVSPYPANTWHKIKIVINPIIGNIEFTANDQVFIIEKGASEVLEGYTAFETGGRNNNEYYLDNLRVSYFVSDETASVDPIDPVVPVVPVAPINPPMGPSLPNYDFEGTESENNDIIASWDFNILNLVIEPVVDPTDPSNTVVRIDRTSGEVTIPYDVPMADSKLTLSYDYYTESADTWGDLVRLQSEFNERVRILFQLSGRGNYNYRTSVAWGAENEGEFAYTGGNILNKEQWYSISIISDPVLGMVTFTITERGSTTPIYNNSLSTARTDGTGNLDLNLIKTLQFGGGSQYYIDNLKLIVE